MEKRNDKLVYLLLSLLLVLLFIRLLPVLRYGIFVFLGLSLIGIPGYWALQRWKQRQREERWAKTVEGRAFMQLERMERLSAKNKAELQRINQSIQDITARRGDKLSESNQQELNRLLAEYQQERALRLTKNAFFDASQERLSSMLKNQELAEELARKKAELEAMREAQFEEMAELENIQYDLETDVFYLDAIDELSEKLSLHTTSTAAKTLKAELEKMTEKLKTY